MSSDIAPVDALVPRAEKEIHQQALSSSNLPPKRNFSLPIFRLPSETLEIIFVQGARDYHESDSGGQLTLCIPTWVNVSYVCSRWRDIALNCPTLWTYHFNVSLRWTEELMLRSKEAPLKMSYSFQNHKDLSWWPIFADKLMEHSKRIQELRWNIPPSLLPAIICLRTPHLEKLEIRLLWFSRMQLIVIADGDKLPLRKLKLINCSLKWFSLNLVGLKELVLLGVRSPTPLNVVDFISVLSKMQNLTHLRLEDVLPSARDLLSRGGLDVSRKINLPRLILLTLSAPLSTVAVLLSCVNVQRSVKISLEPLFEPRSSVGDYIPISSFIAQQFSATKQTSGPTFRSLVLYGGYSLTFSSLEHVHDHQFEELDFNIPLQVTFGRAEDKVTEGPKLPLSDAHQLISNICRSLPLTNIQRLRVIGPHLFSTEFLRELLGRLDGLRYMNLSHGNMPDLSVLSLAACKPGENSDGQPTQDSTLDRILVPALEEMELERITFGHEQSRTSQTSLIDILSTRKGLRDRLTMTECDFKQQDG